MFKDNNTRPFKGCKSLNLGSWIFGWKVLQPFPLLAFKLVIWGPVLWDSWGSPKMNTGISRIYGSPKIPNHQLHPGRWTWESENTPLEEENHLPNHHFSGSMLSFGAVTVFLIQNVWTKRPTFQGTKDHISYLEGKFGKTHRPYPDPGLVGGYVIVPERVGPEICLSFPPSVLLLQSLDIIENQLVTSHQLRPFFLKTHPSAKSKGSASTLVVSVAWGP